jgi:hypothetical protein
MDLLVVALIAFGAGCLVGYGVARHFGRRRALVPAPRAPSSLEATIATDHTPLAGVTAMPGLAATAQQAQAAGARGYLHVISGPSKGQSLLLDRPVLTIGRATDNALVLTGDGVSQHHAELRQVGARYMVKDLGSKNGTFVNDQRMPEKVLAAGDIVAVGATKMFFQG